MCRYRNVWNISLDLQPFYLAGVMGGSGKVYLVNKITKFYAHEIYMYMYSQGSL